MNWLLITIYIIIIIGVIFFVLHRLSYKRKAVWINLDTDQEGTKAVSFVEKQKRFKIIREDGKTKAQVPGFKQKIPYTENNLNPSHYKNRGAVLVTHGENIYFADINVRVIEEGKIKADLKPIPYDQRVNYAETIKLIHKKFTPNKYYLIAGGMVVVAMIISFLMVYFTTDHLEGVIASTKTLSSNLGGLKEQIGNIIAPN